MYGILIREGRDKGGKNIGDYIQSIAQRQFLRNKKTCYVDIEYLSDFKSDEQVNVIMNGWFTWDCSKFLPPACINPLFISFHLTPPQENNFFTPQITEYLKAHEPIGARDTKTKELMEKHGIKSYFSGCLTLTLGREYKQTETKHDGNIYIVDPYVEYGGDKSLPRWLKMIRMIWFSIRHLRKAWLLKEKYFQMTNTKICHISNTLDKVMKTANFYHIYSQRFDDDILLGAKYTTVLVNAKLENYQKFEIADQMLKDYANAKLVITSRLHVSFPCLAVGTRNIFVIPSEKNEDKEVLRYSGRLGGLDDTVNIMELKDGLLQDKNRVFPKKITINNIPDNLTGYKKYDNFLTEKFEEFIHLNP